jgi:hypothetical protein
MHNRAGRTPFPSRPTQTIIVDIRRFKRSARTKWQSRRSTGLRTLDWVRCEPACGMRCVSRTLGELYGSARLDLILVGS